MKKLNQIFPIAVLAIIFMMSSCKDKEELTVDYFPLKVGNSWTYDVYQIDGDNETYGSTIIKNIIGTTIIGEHEFFEIEITSSTGTTGRPNEFIRYDDSGYYLNEEGEYLIYLEGELNEVVSSRVEEILDGEILFEYSKVAENEEVSVPGGTFDCVKYQLKWTQTNLGYDWDSKYNDYYYTNGIGLVKYYESYASTSMLVEYRLKDYNIE